MEEKIIRKIATKFLDSLKELSDSDLEEVINQAKLLDNSWWVEHELKNAIISIGENEFVLRLEENQRNMNL